VIDQLNLAMRNLLVAVLGAPPATVRPADQTAPAGGQVDEFITVKIMDCQGLGGARDVVSDGRGGFVEEIQQVKRFTASVNFFKTATADPAKRARRSNAAFDRAARLEQLLHLSASIETMQAMGLGLLDASAARNLAALVDANWESRGQIDLTFDVINREALPITTVVSAPVSITVQEGAVDATRNFEVTTP
jgi:hypothetical protein